MEVFPNETDLLAIEGLCGSTRLERFNCPEFGNRYAPDL